MVAKAYPKPTSEPHPPRRPRAGAPSLPQRQPLTPTPALTTIAPWPPLTTR